MANGVGGSGSALNWVQKKTAKRPQLFKKPANTPNLGNISKTEAKARVYSSKDSTFSVKDTSLLKRTARQVPADTRLPTTASQSEALITLNSSLKTLEAQLKERDSRVEATEEKRKAAGKELLIAAKQAGLSTQEALRSSDFARHKEKYQKASTLCKSAIENRDRLKNSIDALKTQITTIEKLQSLKNHPMLQQQSNSR
ncbi:hypothetical protein [Endozoicomonas atrinae]|uniref:hypothetical protein n=1 Tax=Endozoicomonas atrinae TaxID=1333660 RepID=UPI0008249CF4|nr:hypothetical protein [Endozoicomonas atrinae]